MANLEKLIGSIENVLCERFSESIRQIAVLHDGYVSFCCPYCGDSKTNPKKKRGTIYLNSLVFKCFNGDCWKRSGHYIELLKDFNNLERLELNEIEEIKQAKYEYVAHQKQLYSCNVNTLFDVDMVKSAAIPLDKLIERKRLIRVEDTPMENYLRSRLQHNFGMFRYSKSENLLYILNLVEDEYVIGYQTRAFREGAKYMTYKLPRIYEDLGMTITDNVMRVGNYSHAFNFFNININKMVTIFEGPLDSFLFKNSTGICSINNKLPINIENKRYLLDYDKAGLKKSIELIKKNQRVFLWRKFIDKYNIKIYKKKIDFNDLVIYLTKHGITAKFDGFFSNNPFDIINLV